MFHEDGTFNFHNEIMTLAEEFCQEWEQRRGPFKNKMEGAYVLNFALCTIRHDIEERSINWNFDLSSRGSHPERSTNEVDMVKKIQKD